MTQRVLLFIAAVGLVSVGLWQLASDRSAEAAIDYEVWVTVQGAHQIKVFGPSGTPRGSDLQLLHTIDYTDPDFVEQWGELRNPHMILFGLHGRPGSRYGYVSNVSSPTAGTSVIDADAREVVAVLDTGFRTHAVQASPNGTRALALAIGAGGKDNAGCLAEPVHSDCGRVTEIITDTATGTFTVGRSFNFSHIAGHAEAGGLLRFDPICGSFTPDSGFFYVTNDSGGLLVLEINEDAGEPLFDVVRIFPRGTSEGQIAAHGCGVGYSADGKLMFANSGGSATGANPESFYYVFRIADHELIKTVNLAGHVEDVHGMMLSPNGAEVIMAGRQSENFIVINQKTGDLKPDRTFSSAPAEAPDLTDFSPDGRWVYVSLRGPIPATGTHDNAGNTPGVAIVRYAPGEVVRVVPLAGDPHGLAVRRLDR